MIGYLVFWCVWAIGALLSLGGLFMFPVGGASVIMLLGPKLRIGTRLRNLVVGSLVLVAAPHVVVAGVDVCTYGSQNMIDSLGGHPHVHMSLHGSDETEHTDRYESRTIAEP
jgi:hypothetical protein